MPKKNLVLGEMGLGYFLEEHNAQIRLMQSDIRGAKRGIENS